MSTESITTLISAYLERYQGRSTRRAYAQVLEQFAQIVGPQTPLFLITPRDLDQFEVSVNQRGLSDETINSYIKRVKSFFNWCVERELINTSPARHLKIRKRRLNLSSKALDPDIRLRMFAAVQNKREELARIRDTAILALMMTYGARSIDIERLTLRRVNLAQGWVYFDRKGHNEDRQPLPPDTARILRAWIDYRHELRIDPLHEYLFVNIRTTAGQRHQPLRASSIQTMFKRLACEVSGEMHGPHSMRHLRAQELLDAGFARELVAGILGHSSIDTLRHYANQDWKRQAQALNATELGRSPAPIAPSEPPRSRGKIVDIDPEKFFRHA